jgi:hypothetical protein
VARRIDVLTYKADIVRDQLGPHLNQLIAAGFLVSYEITKAKGQEGLVMTFKPGRAFFEDYERFYRRGAQGNIRSEFRPEQREIGEPLKLAYLFAEKRTGRPVTSIAYVNSKDVETAKQFLGEITFEEAPAFLDFALAAAKETNFDVQALGGLRQYLARYKSRQVAKVEVKEGRAADRRLEDERLAYDSYRRKETTVIFAELPANAQQEIDALARQASASFGGALADAMYRTKRSQITSQRHNARIKSFNEWKAAQRGIDLGQ